MSDFELTPEELQLFLEEAGEQLETMEDCLVALEKDPTSDELLQRLFRAAHTLKGGAATAGFQEIAELTHAMESVLDLLRRHERQFSPELNDVLLQSLDVLTACLDAVSEVGSTSGFDVSAQVEQLHALSDVGAAAQQGTPSSSTAADVDSATTEPLQQRIAAARERGENVHRWRIIIDPDAPMVSVRVYQVLTVLAEQGELLASDPPLALVEEEGWDGNRVEALLAAQAAPERVEQVLRDIADVQAVERSPIEDAPAGKADRPAGRTAQREAVGQGRRTGEGVQQRLGTVTGNTVRVDVRVLDKLMNLVGELVIDRTRLAQLAIMDLNLHELREELVQLSGHLSRITTDLQDAIMGTRMMPVETLFKKFPRMVRDLARDLGKEIVFEMSGEDTELDRSVIEQIGDPLMHLLRNAVDHGIEPAAERVAAGKPAAGRIRLSAHHQENHIFILVEDDGKGMDAAAVKANAIAKGLIGAEQAAQLSPEEALELIFLPGFSTVKQVSNVSGRGVGMDVVRRNIERLNGSVTITTEPGRGTAFTIKLPLTLAILQALLVRIGGTVFAIPLANVIEAVRVHQDETHLAHGWRMIEVRDQMVPLLQPGQVWGRQCDVRWRHDQANPVVVMQAGGSPLGLMVDELLREQDVVIKSMGSAVGDVPGVSGASLLGDGSVAIIVDVGSLIKGMKQRVAV